MTTGSIISKFETKTKGIDVVLRYGVYIIFLLMIIVFSLTNERFLTVQNFMMISQQAAPHGIAVIGITFVLIVAGIDISIGRNMYLSAILVAIALEAMVPAGMFDTPLGYILVYLLAIVIGGAIGVINGIMVARFNIVPFITTLAVGSIARGIGLIASNSKVYYVEKLGLISNGNVGGIPYVLIIFILLLIIFNYVLRKTPYGRHIMAIGNDTTAARKTGINVRKNVIIAYTICGALAGLGGILSAGQVGNVAVYFAEGNEFIVISAAVLGGNSLFGGKGSILPGAIIGILMVNTIMNGMAMMNASPYAYTIFRGAIIFLAVMVDSFNYKGELR